MEAKVTPDNKFFRKYFKTISGRGKRGVEWINNLVNQKQGGGSTTWLEIERFPQGGRLSLLLRRLMVDDLLSELRMGDFHAQGYTNNITTMIYGKCEGVVSKRMQNAFKLLEG